MLSQSNLANRFVNGETSGQASNVHIERLFGGWTALVGYGWAVYAVRTNDGTIHSYDWYGYSVSTSCQLTAMGIGKNGSNTDVFHEGRPSLRDFDVSAIQL